MQLTLLYCLLNFFAGDRPSENSPSFETKIVEPAKETEATNIILQSKDGGQTWQDISNGLPEIEQPEGFFAGASEVYLGTNGVMYSSKSSLKTPVWEKENVPYLRSTSTRNKLVETGMIIPVMSSGIQQRDRTEGNESTFSSDTLYLPVLITISV
ncbi:MAG: hypothetical protein WDO14_24370 [Bacteroidota bacterium]